MLSDILIAIGFFSLGSLMTLITIAYAVVKEDKKEKKKSEIKKINGTVVKFVYDD